MFKRFTGEAITLHIHLIGRVVHVVHLNQAHQVLGVYDYPSNSFQEASDLFIRMCHSYEYVGFTPDN